MSSKAREPLQQPENLKRFDPLNLPHWTLPMALTWIIWRDLDRVRGQYESYDWHLRDANRLKDSDDEFVPSLPPTRLKHLADVLLETEDSDLPQNFIVRGPAARDDLWLKLGSGMIVATGIPVDGGSRRAIDGSEWVDLDSFVTDGPNYWPVDAIGAGHGDGIRFKSVRVKSESVVATWVRVDASRTAAPPTPRGRRQIYNWEEAKQFLYRLMDEKGDYAEEDQADDWCRQADAERAVVGHMTTDNKGPSENTVRVNVVKIVESWRELQRIERARNSAE
ncbi:MAG: hypothetical protein Q7T45_22450 [Bradyrhizobium sp.]|uniref:hypothetical protein n=1 Tax=Bradyrhizobium sp. TaxID=376 RepID=UPI0027172450|nr:hypothetical protein [Bradyrhizobium sp.]MDO8400583.1 hypothetical protein [Bradyrhizobium sp.]